MTKACLYCARDNPDDVLVCGYCGRDIAVPAALLAEREDLIAKRDAAVAELARITAEIAGLRRKGRG